MLVADTLPAHHTEILAQLHTQQTCVRQIFDGHTGAIEVATEVTGSNAAADLFQLRQQLFCDLAFGFELRDRRLTVSSSLSGIFLVSHGHFPMGSEDGPHRACRADAAGKGASPTSSGAPRLVLAPAELENHIDSDLSCRYCNFNCGHARFCQRAFEGFEFQQLAKVITTELGVRCVVPLFVRPWVATLEVENALLVFLSASRSADVRPLVLSDKPLLDVELFAMIHQLLDLSTGKLDFLSSHLFLQGMLFIEIRYGYPMAVICVSVATFFRSFEPCKSSWVESGRGIQMNARDMERGDGVSIPEGAVSGVVRSFVESKAYGFIDGDDGESYFVHIKEVQGGVALVTGQQVSFIPKPSPKGSKATQVIAGQAPTLIYVEPDKFMVSKSPVPNGLEVIVVVGKGWAESNDPHRAREDLIQLAKSYGANAIINNNLERYTQQQACSNYKFTMHRQHGEFAVVKRVGSSSDPVVIEDARQQMQAIKDWWEQKNPPAPETDVEAEPREPLSLTSLVPPAKVKFVAVLLWSWTCTIGKILWLTGRHVAKKGIAKLRRPQNT